MYCLAPTPAAKEVIIAKPPTDMATAVKKVRNLACFKLLPARTSMSSRLTSPSFSVFTDLTLRRLPSYRRQLLYFIARRFTSARRPPDHAFCYNEW